MKEIDSYSSFLGVRRFNIRILGFHDQLNGNKGFKNWRSFSLLVATLSYPGLIYFYYIHLKQQFIKHLLVYKWSSELHSSGNIDFVFCKKLLSLYEIKRRWLPNLISRRPFGNVNVCPVAFYSIYNREVRRAESPPSLSNCLFIFPLFFIIFCPAVLDVFHKVAWRG